ncbi:MULTISPECIES: Fe-S cluster assembly protein SufD [unclassified Bartonella]|uniref:Fe-S cluster assembly protein SufD n=1 Tax=unclassified Bartonella TaxID=2645622 RepID=UPI00099ABD93|nr:MULTISPECIES: Fe-S cluster assembly protein SufD [unclassified Bartonella]AQX28026.1 Fe-S cluster assembly protein SufD [Bartonella sp. JB15]AQX29303.1 Fe-S cluster assembly protein SufD [Bartonella sp. JB63]
MSTNSQPKLIAVEEDIISNFNQRIGDLPGNETVQVIRKKAIELFQKTRLPSRKMEYWHYTNLRVLLKSVSDFSEFNSEQSVDKLLPENIVFSIENGKALTLTRIVGVEVEHLATALDKNRAKINSTIADENFIGQLNTAFFTDGWLFQVADNTTLDTPIELQNIQMGGQSHIFSKIKVGKNSQVVIIERQIGNDKDTFVSSVFSLNLAANSNVTWILIRDRGSNAKQFGQFRARLAENSQLTLYVINIGSQLNRQEIDIELLGKKSNFQLRAINLLSGKTHSDLTMTVRHVEEKSISREIVRNVVTNKAHGAFQGIIRVEKKAQETDARMACNSLILSDDAEFDIKPELEIFADDVACSHGATVAKINHDHLFYLMARGISYKTACELLVKGFISELIDDIKQDSMHTILSNIIIQWLEKNI